METGMTITNKEVHAGQAIYSKRTLNAYDFIVLWLSNRFIWRCPTPTLLAHYNQHISNNHLDVGVGTGYFLDHCQFPSGMPRIALMDLNQNSLAYAAQRIARYQPTTHVANVLEPIHMDAEKFDSIGINYLLHCIPGSLESKAAAFDHLATLLNPKGVLFGSTILHQGVKRNALAKRLMAFYNSKGVFHNQHDSLNGLEQALRQYFTHVNVTITGCVAIFSASG